MFSHTENDNDNTNFRNSFKIVTDIYKKNIFSPHSKAKDENKSDISEIKPLMNEISSFKVCLTDMDKIDNHNYNHNYNHTYNHTYNHNNCNNAHTDRIHREDNLKLVEDVSNVMINNKDNIIGNNMENNKENNLENKENKENKTPTKIKDSKSNLYTKKNLKFTYDGHKNIALGNNNSKLNSSRVEKVEKDVSFTSNKTPTPINISYKSNDGKLLNNSKTNGNKVTGRIDNKKGMLLQNNNIKHKFRFI